VIFYRIFLLMLLSTFSVMAEDETVEGSLTKESKRSVVIGHDLDLQNIYEEALKAEGKEKRNLFNKIVRAGRDSLIEKDDNLYVNARDLALTYIIQMPAEEDSYAARYLDKAEDDIEGLLKVVSRYPNSVAAIKALKLLLDSKVSMKILSEWFVLVKGRQELSSYLPKKEEKKVHFPSSEIHPFTHTFPTIKDKALTPYFPGGMLSSYSYGNVNRRPVVYRHPLDSVLVDGPHLILANYKGLVWYESKKNVFDERQRFAVSNRLGMLSTFDNNILSDFTKIGRRLYSPQRNSPVEYDKHKNLYIVGLPRHAMHAFDLEASKELKVPEDVGGAKKNWPAQWSLSDKNKTFNCPLVAHDKYAYLTSTAFQGLFNVELNKVDLSNGTIKWHLALSSGQQELNYFGRQTRECLAGIPAYKNRRLYLSSNVGALHCVNDEGRVLWSRRYQRVQPTLPIKFSADVPMRISRFRNQMPQIQGDRVYFSPLDSEQLLCVNRVTGELLWSRNFPVSITYDTNSFKSDFYKKIHWQLGENGITLFNYSEIIRLNPKTGKIVLKKALDANVTGIPMYFKNVVACAVEDKILVYDLKTLELKKTIRITSLKKNIGAGRELDKGEVTMLQANMSYSGGDYLVLWGLYRVTGPHMYGEKPGLLYLIRLGD